MNRVTKRITILLSALCLAGVIGVGIGYYYVFYPNITVKDDGIIYVRNSDSITEVLDTLRSRGYVKHPSTLLRVARLKNAKTKAGRYRIREGMNNNELVNMLRSGNQSPVQLTFNNIRTLEEFAGMVSRQLDISPEELLSRLRDPDTTIQYGFSPATVIGMFVPNTYEIYWNISTSDFLKRMYKEYQRFWNKQRREKAEAIGLSPLEVTVLASIIEEETVKPEEYPVIAGVYLNRLKKGIKLDACPTLKYVLGDFTITRILDRYLEIDSPYNTYKHAGLPPGPIRMASIQVIDGVLNYQKHDYLYFCAKSDFSGYHYFSRTLRQHNAYAREYHRELDRRKIWK
ncbi:endolytic transglycosylase MltG [uncultured Sanguibacteroides sp.]|uniref:endolytic transglycosylase MltG n=1 Tax=uncultured Sanguibacteroides sp. TaxID=1635151 RepID=UPI0025F9682C|nr:endolytic transglycosylase MltG [uncultured Sanguibacteroides sp.]